MRIPDGDDVGKREADEALLPTRIDELRATVDRIETLADAVTLRDQAAALRVYAQRRRADEEARRIGEICLRLDRRIGQLLPPAPTPQESGKRGGRPARSGKPGKGSRSASTLSDSTPDLPTPREQKQLRAIAKLPEAEFEKVAKAEAPSRRGAIDAVRRIKEATRDARRAENAEKVQAADRRDPAAEARWATIVADPPWHWDDMDDSDQFGRSRPTYETMHVEDLERLAPWERAVRDLADEDAHLYLWVTNRSMMLAHQLVEPWGFRFVTMLTWCKPSIGMGNYFRGSTEHVLFCVRGSQRLRRKDVGTWFAAPRGPKGHSSKPSEFYDLVESCSPGPYLDLFSRMVRPGWTTWGEDA